MLAAIRRASSLVSIGSFAGGEGPCEATDPAPAQEAERVASEREQGFVGDGENILGGKCAEEFERIGIAVEWWFRH
jgi:hypothetical protein